MPASEIMSKFREHKLHSGSGGKIVRNPKQAKAILLSYLRKEGRIPERQQGGPADKGGPFLLHEGEKVVPKTGISSQVPQGYTSPDVIDWRKPSVGRTLGEAKNKIRDVYHRLAQDDAQYQPYRSRQDGGSGGGDAGAAAAVAGGVTGTAQDAQGGADVAAQKANKSGVKFSLGKGSGDNPWLSQMQSAVASPLDRTFDEGYRASMKTGGNVPETGVYRLHEGEYVVPKNLASRYSEFMAGRKAGRCG